MAFKFPTNILTVQLFGYLLPPVVVFTIFSNTLTCIALLKKHMRNPTNIILLAIALLYMSTGIIVLPGAIYYYTLGNHKEYIPYNLCMITRVVHLAVPRIFHAASMWLTVMLALQRYISVCHPQVANRWCTIAITIRCIIVICILAVPTNIIYVISTTYASLDMPSLLDPGKNITGCSGVARAILGDYMHTLSNSIEQWFNGVFVKLIPCFFC